MLKKRIIPCLDIKDGRTVKGTNFENLRDAGDPVELAKRYSDEGADELVFLDITATQEERDTLLHLVEKVALEINIPFSVGGGIGSVDLVYQILQKGADKISVNSAAVRNPELVTKIADRFGSQCCIVAIDARFVEDSWIVHTHGGRRPTEIELFAWAKEMEERGAGEILFTSMDHDGTKEGFAIDALSKMADLLTIPIIASGGAGKKDHFKEVFSTGKADAGLAASIFHYKEIPISELKAYLHKQNIPVRL
jgi:cyclase